jgi:hypothetical protein
MSFKRVLLFTLSLSTFTSFTWAQDDVAFNSLRQIGMGGVGIATGHDIYSLYMNPAALETAQDNKIYVPLGLQYGQGETGFSALQSAYDSYKKTNNVSAFNNLVPSEYSIQAGLSPLGFTQAGWGVGFFGRGQARIQLLNPVAPRIEGEAFIDGAALLGKSLTVEIMKTPVTFGASVRFMNRMRWVDSQTNSAHFSVHTADLISGDNDVLTQKIQRVNLTGFGGDLGVLMPLGSGQFGAVYRNLGSALQGNYVTTASRTVSYKESLPSYLGIGYSQPVDASELPWVGPLIQTFTVAADCTFLHNDMYQNIRLGVEKKIGTIAALRAGLNQGYPTLGLGLDFNLLRLQYAFSTYEAGQFVGDAPVSQHHFEVSLLTY